MVTVSFLVILIKVFMGIFMKGSMHFSFFHMISFEISHRFSFHPPFHLTISPQFLLVTLALIHFSFIFSLFVQNDNLNSDSRKVEGHKVQIEDTH